MASTRRLKVLNNGISYLYNRIDAIGRDGGAGYTTEMSMSKGRMLKEVEALQSRVRELLDQSVRGSPRDTDGLQMNVAPGGKGQEDFVFEHGTMRGGAEGEGDGGGE